MNSRAMLEEQYNDLALRTMTAIKEKVGDYLEVEEKDAWYHHNSKEYYFTVRPSVKVPEGTHFSYQIRINPRGGKHTILGADVRYGAHYWRGQPSQITLKNADKAIPELVEKIYKDLMYDYNEVLGTPKRIAEETRVIKEFDQYVKDQGIWDKPPYLNETYMGSYYGYLKNESEQRNIRLEFNKDYGHLEVHFSGLDKEKLSEIITLLKGVKL